MKVQELIMKVQELIMKVWELIMNTNPKNEGAIADNEGMKGIILGFFLQMAPHTI